MVGWVVGWLGGWGVRKMEGEQERQRESSGRQTMDTIDQGTYQVGLEVFHLGLREGERENGRD